MGGLDAHGSLPTGAEFGDRNTTMRTSQSFSPPALRGGLLALLAALLFGASTPRLQLFGKQVGVFSTATCFYAGAALAGGLLRRPAGCCGARRRERRR
jgi:hypothetical protein